jgi:hypothetical protein
MAQILGQLQAFNRWHSRNVGSTYTIFTYPANFALSDQDLEAETHTGYTPLHRAVSPGLSIASACQTYRSPIDVLPSLPSTQATAHAADVVEVLLKAGANKFATSSGGHKAGHITGCVRSSTPQNEVLGLTMARVLHPRDREFRKKLEGLFDRHNRGEL